MFDFLSKRKKSGSVRFRARPRDARHAARRITPLWLEQLESRALLAAIPPAGLVSWHRAEGNTLDSAYHNTGTLLGGATFAAGKVGQAFSFDGVDDEVRIPHRPSQDAGNQLTIEAWINPDTLDHGRPIAQKRSLGNVGGFTLETTHSSIPGEPANGLQFVLWTGSTPTSIRLATPPDSLTAGAWQHVAATYDGSTMKIFVDGVELASQPASGTISPATEPLVIGRNVVIPAFAWDGLIDELSLYNRALSPVEIQAIVAAGSEGKDPEAVVFRADFDQAESTIYQADFEDPVGSEWSHSGTDVTPIGNRRFLGQFGNDSVTLTIDADSIDQDNTQAITVAFDLLVLRSWDGNHNGGGSGPDRWSLVSSGVTLLDTTFSNNHPNTGFAGQAYPGAFGTGQFSYHTGASEINTLGFTFPGVGTIDSVYRLEFTFAYTGGDVELTFTGALTTPGDDESWGLDNVNVAAVTQVASQFSGVKVAAPVAGYAAHGFSGNLLHNRVLPAAPTRLTLANLPPHEAIDLRFLLAAIDSWDGDQKPGQFFAPDLFNVTVDGNVVFSHTLVNALSAGNTQSYAAPPGVELVRYQQRGFNPDNSDYLDSAYNLGLDPAFQNIPHTASTLTVEWSAGGSGYEGGSNESWGIDNVEVVLRGAGDEEQETADLAVTIDDSADPVVIGDSVTYSVHVTNHGPADATGVIVVAHGQAGQPFNNVSIPVGGLDSGASSSFELVFTPAALGSFSVMATVVAAEDDPNLGNNSFTETTEVIPRLKFELAQAQYEVREGEEFAVLTVQRIGDLATSASVEFTTVSGTAVQRGVRGSLTPVADYTPTNGTLFFRPRSNIATIRVPIRDDSALEPDETFRVILSNPSDGAQLGAITSADVIIHDNDPSVSFVATSSERGEGAGGRSQIEVRLHPASNQTVTVTYAVTGGTATQGTDFNLPRLQTLTFRPRETRKFIEFTNVNDTVYEGDETATIELVSATNAFVGPESRHRVTIVDNDPVPPPPDPGSTIDTALFIDLQTLPRQSYRHLLVRANGGINDIDTFRVHLDAGEAVALDVDADGNPAFFVAGLGNSTLTILGSNGQTPDIQQLAVIGRSAEPDTGAVTNNPAHLFRAPATGDYYFQLQANANGLFGYRMHFHRLGVAENVPAPELLNVPGPMFAWYEASSSGGDATVGISGPTGYGFTLEGPWQQQLNAGRNLLKSQTLRLPTGSRFTLRSREGFEVPLLADGPIVITTKSQRWGDSVGEVNATAINFPVGLDIAPVNDLIEDTFGSQIGAIGLLTGNWRISLGGNVLAVSTSRGLTNTNSPIDQLLAGVPYLRQKGPINVTAQLGPISISYPVIEKPVDWAFDPADPMLYLKGDELGQTKNPALAVSLHGLLEYNPQDAPNPLVNPGVTHIYGHIYGAAVFPVQIGPVPFQVDAEVVLNVDADRDGRPLGDLADVADVFDVLKGDFSEFEEIAGDIQLGANGIATATIPEEEVGAELEMKAGRASVVLNGLTDTIWVRGESQSENPFPNSPIEFDAQGTVVYEGLIDFDSGDFLYAVTASSSASGIELAYNYTITHESISVSITGSISWNAEIDYLVGTVSGKAKATINATIGLEIDENDDVYFTGSISATGKLTARINGSNKTLFEDEIDADVRNKLFKFEFPRGVGSLSFDPF
ncbi:MAG TPA: LamG-like jellyroll fold domain-containing protein [Pirellulales bacterium]|nr:LamG-like jellyroll fold domain-containing protein [Pirellulales bacterium]